MNSKPGKQPMDKIEWLISRHARSVDQRISERLPVESGTEVLFPLICKGEVIDVSKEGISIRFKPEDSPKLQSGQKIPLTLELNGRIIHIPAELRRTESRFGVFVLGLQFDPDAIEVEE
ncbi:PilZ domain-containing protein [bacterium]|nr:PilZ domain-containing protein [candidate division CSSED10-310 bacterium]